MTYPTVNDFVAWYEKAWDDEDCTYLNDSGWDDIKALVERAKSAPEADVPAYRVIDLDKLRALISESTDSDLSDGGRYFHEDCNDLTQCGHGDTGEYRNRHDGKLIELLWNNRAAILAMAEERELMRKALDGLYAAVNARSVRGRDHVPSMRHEQKAMLEALNVLRALGEEKA